MVVGAILVAITLVFGRIVYDSPFPSGGPLFEFTVTFLVGSLSFAALALALTAAIPNAEAAPPIVNAAILPLLFLSGIFIPLDTAPEWITTVADIFPVKHFADAMRAGFLGNIEVAGSASSSSIGWTSRSWRRGDSRADPRRPVLQLGAAPLGGCARLRASTGTRGCLGAEVVLIFAALTVLAAACGEEVAPPADDGTAAEPAQETAAECTAAHAADLFETETLTVGTDFDFMFPPWIIDRDPESGEGFESALTYAIADQMGFADSQVDWVSVPFNSSYAPGPKDFDFDINNISVTEERDRAVDFSDSYYDLTQALLVLKGSPIENATTMAEIQDSVFGAQVGTTSLEFINTVIQPTKDPKVFDSTSDAKAALRNGPSTASSSTCPRPTSRRRSTRRTGHSWGSSRAGEYLGILFEEGSPWSSA